MSIHSYCPALVMMEMAPIHFSGLVHRIGLALKDLLCQMNTESACITIFSCFSLYFVVETNSCLHSFIYAFFRTNILDRYFNKDFTLKLPDNKKITEIKWLAIYDLSTQNDFGDIYIPEAFEPPMPQRGSSFSKRSHGVTSGVIEIIDSKTIKIPEFFYDGGGSKTYFLGGVGAQPSAKGTKIPDELG